MSDRIRALMAMHTAAPAFSFGQKAIQSLQAGGQPKDLEMPDMPVEAPPMDLPSDEVAGADIGTFGLEMAPKSPFEPDDLPPVIRKKQRPEPYGPSVVQRKSRY